MIQILVCEKCGITEIYKVTRKIERHVCLICKKEGK